MRIDLPHVTARSNADGKVRYYFRRRGQPIARLPDNPLLPEFMEAYARHLDWTPLGAVREGSFAWLCNEYLESVEFTTKAKATRAARRRIVLHMEREPLERGFPETFGMEMIARFTPAHVATLRDRKAASPNAANERLKILSQMFRIQVAKRYCAANPVPGVERLAVPRGGHITATDADIAAYEDFHTSGAARRAMALLKSFGVRVSDLRILGPQHITAGRLEFRTVKTGVQCRLPIPEELRSELYGSGDLAFLLNEWGRPFLSDKALSQRVAKWFRQAGVDGVTAHGVRKWLATRMADRGATEYELMAFFGWRDAKEARPYVEAANRVSLSESAGRKGATVTPIKPNV